jgi:RsiW-degrading membrane proteinase PrsW (M82 family)
MTGYLIAVAVVPALLLMWYFHTRDVFKEPARVLWGTFGWGVMSIIPAVLIGLAVEHKFAWVTQPYWSAGVGALLVAGIPEEICKLAVLLGYSYQKHEFDEPMDGVVYGVAASLGFATLENLMYVLDEGMAVGVMRGLMAVPGHAFMGAIMGYYVGQSRFDAANKNRLVLKGLGLAVLIHAVYDYPILLLGALKQAKDESSGAALLLLLVSVFVVILGWRWAIALVRRLRREQVERG